MASTHMQSPGLLGMCESHTNMPNTHEMRKCVKAEGCSGDMKGISVVFGHIKVEIASVIRVNLLGHLLICEF